MAVEEDGGAWGEEAEEGDAGGELVDEDVVEGLDLAGEEEVEGEVELAEDGAEDGEAAEEVWGEEGVAGDADGEGAWGVLAVRRLNIIPGVGEICTITSLIEAMPRVAVGSVDDNFVPPVLKPDSCIDDQPLRSPNPQIRVDKEDPLW